MHYYVTLLIEKVVSSRIGKDMGIVHLIFKKFGFFLIA